MDTETTWAQHHGSAAVEALIAAHPRACPDAIRTAASRWHASENLAGFLAACDPPISYGLAALAMSGPGSYWLTAEAYDCPGCGWADELSRLNDKLPQSGPVATVEGIDWRDACLDHGFWGAVAKVKGAYRLRLQGLSTNARQGHQEVA
jgi:hypothetical protein